MLISPGVSAPGYFGLRQNERIAMGETPKPPLHPQDLPPGAAVCIKARPGVHEYFLLVGSQIKIGLWPSFKCEKMDNAVRNVFQLGGSYLGLGKQKAYLSPDEKTTKNDIVLRFVPLSPQQEKQVWSFLNDSALPFWQTRKFNIFTRNCRHFANNIMDRVLEWKQQQPVDQVKSR